jgi:hypothetical protein
MLQTQVVEKIKTHILCSITFSRKPYRLWDNVDKYGRVGVCTDPSQYVYCHVTETARVEESNTKFRSADTD